MNNMAVTSRGNKPAEAVTSRDRLFDDDDEDDLFAAAASKPPTADKKGLSLLWFDVSSVCNCVLAGVDIL